MANVLIIDDDEPICEMFCDYITRVGHSANYAHTLSEGLKIVKNNNFDVVFLDMGLPDGNPVRDRVRDRRVRLP